MATQAVQTQSNQAVTRTGGADLKKWLGSEAFKNAVAVSLPKHLTPDRFIRTGLTAMLKIPKLAECTQESVFECMLTLSQLGLEPDGRRAHLIPFKKNTKTDKGWVTEMRCQLIIDYKGIAELVMRSGLVSNIHADVVCENDEFEYDLGEVVKHKIDFRKDRGEPFAAYCRIKFKDGTCKAEAMSVAEIEKVRARSKSGQDGPWVTDWSEMAKKTAARRCMKWVPWSPEERENIEKDDTQFEVDRRPREVATINIAQLTASMDQNRGHDATAVIEEGEVEEITSDSTPSNEDPKQEAAEPEPDPNEPPSNLQHFDAWPDNVEGRWYWIENWIMVYDDASGNYRKHSERKYTAPVAQAASKPVFGKARK